MRFLHQFNSDCMWSIDLMIIFLFTVIRYLGFCGAILKVSFPQNLKLGTENPTYCTRAVRLVNRVYAGDRNVFVLPTKSHCNITIYIDIYIYIFRVTSRMEKIVIL